MCPEQMVELSGLNFLCAVGENVGNLGIKPYTVFLSKR